MEIDIPDTPPRLVVNCMFSPEKVFEVSVASSSYILDTAYTYIKNATVKLYTDNIFTELLLHEANGIYKTSGYKPEINKTYRIEVSAVNYETVTATSYLPKKVIINSINESLYTEIDDYGNYYSKVQLTFSDFPNDSNYYELLIIYDISLSRDISLFDSSYYNEFCDKIINDSTCKSYHLGFASIFSDSPVFSEQFKSRNMYFGNSKHAIFTDKLFSGQTYTLDIDFFNIDNAILPDTAEYKIILSSITKDYYKYLSINNINQNTSGSEFLDEFWDGWRIGEAIQMYSNIENGYGIFSGYNFSTDSCIYTNL